MENLHFTIFIEATPQKVWDTMLSDGTYREWTKPFNETSFFQGDWSLGSKMLFLGTDETGKINGGMVSMVAENKPLEKISLKHIAMMENDQEIPLQSGSDAYENYIFTPENAGTKLDIELLNIPTEWMSMMDESWPKALQVLKRLAEK